jgi:hypothetical protein
LGRDQDKSDRPSHCAMVPDVHALVYRTVVTSASDSGLTGPQPRQQVPQWQMKFRLESWRWAVSCEHVASGRRRGARCSGRRHARCWNVLMPSILSHTRANMNVASEFPESFSAACICNSDRCEPSWRRSVRSTLRCARTGTLCRMRMA